MKKILLAGLMLALGTLPVQAETAPKRIVSVGGAVTEILYAIGAAEQVVGSDTTSYYPQKAAQLPKVGYQRALSAEGVLSLSPDYLLATTDAGPGPVLKQIEAAGIKQMTVPAAHSLDQTFLNIKEIAAAVGKKTEGAKLLQDLTEKRTILQKDIEVRGKKPRILFMMQHGGGPMMVAGQKTAAQGIIELAGGVNAVSEFEGFRPLTAESVIAQAPDYILTTDRAFKSVGGIEGVLKSPGLSLTPAGKSGQVIKMDALLLLGFGPRTVEAARILFDLTKS